MIKNCRNGYQDFWDALLGAERMTTSDPKRAFMAHKRINTIDEAGQVQVRRARKRVLPLRWRILTVALCAVGITVGALGLWMNAPQGDMARMPLVGSGIGVGLWVLGLAGALVTKRLGIHDYPAFRLLGPLVGMALLVRGVGLVDFGVWVPWHVTRASPEPSTAAAPDGKGQG